MLGHVDRTITFAASDLYVAGSKPFKLATVRL
jgi:hypothetical protein